MEGDFIIVPAWAGLNSRKGERDLTAGVETENRQIFDIILRPSPPVSETWSEWTAPRQRFDGSKPAPNEQYLARYRVRFGAEYSPTPSPTPDEQIIIQEGTPDDSATPAPTETPTPEPTV